MLYVYIKQKHGRAKKINEYNDDEDTTNNNNDDDHDNNADRTREAHGENSGIECRAQSFFFSTLLSVRSVDATFYVACYLLTVISFHFILNKFLSFTPLATAYGHFGV